MILTFGEFQLDSDRFELRRNGQLCKVEPKVFDLMAHFAKNPGRVFSRDDLVASVWHGRVVSDATVSTCIKNARKAVGDSGVTQRYIKTVRGRGFRFAADVEHADVRADSGAETQTADAARRGGSGPSLLIGSVSQLVGWAGCGATCRWREQRPRNGPNPHSTVAFEQPHRQV